MKKILFLFVIVLFFLIGCTNKPIACTEEAKLCPDGSAVGRIGPNCEFAECPDTTVVKEKCDYEENTIRKYVEKSEEACSRVQILCEPSRTAFSDECGCGCELIQDGNIDVRNFCTEEQKKADACIEIFRPVCGWSDPEKIQCIKYPCASTFSNSCFACVDENVLYWTEGECPE